jgi:hypothetical protein
MLDWFKRGSGPGTNAGVFGWYRQRAEALRRGETAKRRAVRLRVPSGIGRMNMLRLNVAADGTVEMPEEEAESFLRAVIGDGREARHPPGVVTVRQGREPNTAAARVKRQHLRYVGFPVHRLSETPRCEPRCATTGPCRVVAATPRCRSSLAR